MAYFIACSHSNGQNFSHSEASWKRFPDQFSRGKVSFLPKRDNFLWQKNTLCDRQTFILHFKTFKNRSSAGNQHENLNIAIHGIQWIQSLYSIHSTKNQTTWVFFYQLDGRGYFPPKHAMITVPLENSNEPNQILTTI